MIQSRKSKPKLAKFLYSDFAFVDVAENGTQNRNVIQRFDELKTPIGAVDCFTSMYRFRQDFRDHVSQTKSVRGANKFACYSDYLFFDIDDPEDLNAATLAAQTLVRGLLSMAKPEHIVVAFSGYKGFSIGVVSSLFGFAPSITLPNEIKIVAEQLASLFGVEIDTKIYESSRLWRLENTIHSKTVLYKTRLDTKKFPSMSLEEIKTAAAVKKGRKAPAYLLAPVVKPLDTLCEFAKSAITKGHVRRETSWDKPILSGRQQKINQAALDYLLSTGVKEGNRGNETLLRAAESCKLGVNEKSCLQQLLKWNRLNQPPLDESEIQSTVRSAYTGNYDFGTNNKSLATARSQGKDVVDSDDIRSPNPISSESVELNTMEDVMTFVKLRYGILSAIVAYPDKEISELGLRYFSKIGVPAKMWQVLVLDQQRPDGLPDGCDAPSFSDLLKYGVPKPLKLVGEYFSWRKRISLLVGKDKESGKSTLCTFEALTALKKGYRVLWVSPDEARDDILDRFIKAGLVLGTERASRLFICGDENITPSWDALKILIQWRKPDLLVLDSLHSLFPILEMKSLPDSSDTSEWQKLINTLRPLAISYNMAVVLIHHVNKQSGKAMGSIGITAGVDAIISLIIPSLKKTRQSDTHVRELEFLGRRVNSKMNCTLIYIDEQTGYQKFEWEQKTEDTTKSLSKIDHACLWLYELLKGGEQSIKHTHATAKHKDQKKWYLPSTLTAAIKRMKIISSGECYRLPDDFNIEQLLNKENNHD